MSEKRKHSIYEMDEKNEKSENMQMTTREGVQLGTLKIA